MARYRVGNAYLSEEEYAGHHKEIEDRADNARLFIFSIILFCLISYQSNIYLKAHYTSLFSAEMRVALSLVPGLFTGIIIFVFRPFLARVLSMLITLSITGTILYLLWKITFYFLA